MNNDPLESINRGIQIKLWYEIALERWLIILGIAFLGALVGLVFSYLRPQVFEAEAVLGVGINYGVTEPLELVVEDRTLGRVVALILSDSVFSDIFERLPKDLKEERNWTTYVDLHQNTRLDRRLGDWGLIAQDIDPGVAAELSQLWAEVAIQQLDEAMRHAWRAAALLGGEFDVDCEQLESNDIETAIWQCQVSPVDFDVDALEGELQTELELSRGVLPIISYELLRSPIRPDKPAVWGRGGLVLGGAFAGLIIGFGLCVAFAKRQDPSPDVAMKS